MSHDPLHLHRAGTLGMVLSQIPTDTSWYGAVNTLTAISSEQLLNLLAASKQSRQEALGVLCLE